MMKRLFVYGSLAPGRPNEHVLSDIGGTWQKASVKGYLKAKGWGAKMGFPGIVLDDSADEVPGYIFYSENLPQYLIDLDKFEGEEYERVLTEAIVEDGSSMAAYIYVLCEMNK